MLEFEHDITIPEGGRFRLPMIWKSGATAETAVEVDITGYTARMQVRAKNGDRLPLLDYSTGIGGFIVIADQVTDKGKFTVDDEDGVSTQGVCKQHLDVDAVYDLFLYDATPIPVLRLHGDCTIEAATTRPWEG